MKNQLSAIKALFRFRIYTIINIIGMGHRTKRILRIERKEYQTY